VNAQVNALTVVPGPGGTSSCSTADPCANGNFPAGANGLATMTVDGPNSAVNLTANLKDKAGLPLYSGAKPASLTYLCPLGRCPLNLAFRGFGGISANDDLLPSTAVVGAKCSNNGIVLQDVAAGAGGKKYCVYNAWEESVELAQSYRLTVAFPTTANPNPAPVQVEACQVYKGSSLISKLSQGSALASVKTVPTGTQACLDVTSVTRSADGTVAFPVYYWNDIIIKAR